ncbi:unnamed protein product [Trifolium pratense]|uniref:Uncharacterized protein n=1 Tax=Trifolium pratense TaxID=57577 RepID=A0ACB0LBH2_TRIPR|nr:unnamed protein product [Trifolium pratense]
MCILLMGNLETLFDTKVINFFTNFLYAACRNISHCSKLLGPCIIWASSLQRLWFIYIFLDDLIYILGGVSGNLASFLHTPDPTVGGTGPVFAIIGAWLMYQIQNRDVVANDDSDNLFKKAMIITALGFILCNLGPIDEWYVWHLDCCCKSY